MSDRVIVPRLELATVRGIACVALVAYHVIGPTVDSGMHLPDGSAWHRLMNSMDFLRMPLFSTLSGYFYAANRVEIAFFGTFLAKKARRLAIPLLFVTTVTFLLRRLAYGDRLPFLDALFFHYQHLWFIQALIVIFAVIALWDCYARPNWAGLCIAAFATAMVSRSFQVTEFFSLNGALYLAPFFLFGMILRTEGGLLVNRHLLILATWFVVIVLLLYEAITIEGGNPITRNSLPAAVCGFGAAYLMFACCPRISVFQRIGMYSYTIYLWHSIAASAVRQGLEGFVQLPVAVEFALLLASGIIIPIAIHWVVRRQPVLALLMAGIRVPVRSPDAEPAYPAESDGSNALRTTRS